MPPGLGAARATTARSSELVALAESAPRARSLVDPDDPLLRGAGDMPRRIREYCAGTGQPEPDGGGAVVRCILESLALKHAQTIDLLADGDRR